MLDEPARPRPRARAARHRARLPRRATGTTLPDAVLRGSPRSTARSSARSRTTTTRRATRAGSTRPPSCGPGSSCSPTSARAAPSRTSACCARRWTSSSSARTPRASTPTATCMPAAASSCRTPDSAFSIRKSRRGLASGWPAPPSSSPGPAAGTSPRCTRPTCSSCPTACSCARSREVAADYPDVELRELIVDAAAARLIRDPGSFDVLVTTNMFGDILSDEASELCGSLGLGGAINAGDGSASRRPSTAPPPTSPGRASPTRPR